MHLGEGRDTRFLSLYDDGKTLLRAPDLSDPLLLVGKVVWRLCVVAVWLCGQVELFTCSPGAFEILACCHLCFLFTITTTAEV